MLGNKLLRAWKLYVTIIIYYFLFFVLGYKRVTLKTFGFQNMTTKIYKYWESVQKDIVITSATGVLSAVTLRHGIVDEISISYEVIHSLIN